MDFFLPQAWRLVFVAEPVARVASMYYYEAGYTHARQAPHDCNFARHNTDPSFANPLNPRDYMRRHAHLTHLYEARHWQRVQWHWLREGTPNRTLDDVIRMLRSGAFLVGLTAHFDASLLLWRHCMGLFIEDILYSEFKTEFDHPSLSDWPPEHQQLAQHVVHQTGDARFHAAATELFEWQVAYYGGWAKLSQDTAAFVAVNKQVNAACQHVAMASQEHGLHPKAVCLVRTYRHLRLAAQFDEL